MTRRRLHSCCPRHWHLTPNSSLCPEHFSESDFFEVNSSRVSRHKKLKRNAVPSIFPWTSIEGGSTSTPSFDARTVEKTYSKQLPIAFAEEILLPTLDESNEIDPLILPEVLTDNIEIEEIVQVETSISEVDLHVKNQSTQTDEQSEIIEQPGKIPFSSEHYKHNSKAIHFFTGLEDFDRLNVVYLSLGKDVENLKYPYLNPPKKISPFEQFFLTLMVLRQHYRFEDISIRYLIPIKQVYNIFITWARFMALQWKNIDLWISKEATQTNAPLDFYDKYPMTRLILDATECPVNKPKLPLAQQITFSSYKNRNTVKALVGITPNGLISYVSPCYGGSATDRQIIERSSVLTRFNFKDEIMVDKGLNVQDIFLGYGVKVNMPSFFKRGNQINPETLSSNRKVASKREFMLNE